LAYIGNKPANKAVVASDLDPAVITGQTALAVAPADTDEFLISDAGVLKRLDASLIGGANTPAFYAHNTSATSCSASAHTKIIFDTEIFDSDGKFDNSASRFTPTVAGKYFVSSQISLASAQDGANYRNELYKNGSLYAQSQDWMYGGDYTTNLNSVVDLDTDDYIEIFVYHNSAGGTKNTVTTNKANFFSAFRIIT